jgi:major vault protein
VLLSAAADASRSINRGTKDSKGYEGNANVMRRGTQFTPPPMLTLNTKYDGVPSINVWTGWAVQVVDKSGSRRVVVGPETVLLEYDESLEIIELSTGKPKSTDRLVRDVYLRCASRPRTWCMLTCGCPTGSTSCATTRTSGSAWRTT